MRVGVIGGTFNPIHIGHLNMACEVMGKMSLDRIYFVVSARPPHKVKDSELIGFKHRYNMTELATEDVEAFYPSKIEMKRDGLSYTIDTVRYFQKEFGDNVYFITGQDAMEDVGSWHSASTLLKSCNFVVATRPGYDISTLNDVLQSVLSVRYKNLKIESVGKDEDGDGETLHVVGGVSKIHLVPTTQLDISSSAIRKKLQKNESVKYLVTEKVRKYLNETDLFLL